METGTIKTTVEEKPLRSRRDIAGFPPPEIVEKMLEYQEKQGNQRCIEERCRQYSRI